MPPDLRLLSWPRPSARPQAPQYLGIAVYVVEQNAQSLGGGFERGPRNRANLVVDAGEDFFSWGKARLQDLMDNSSRCFGVVVLGGIGRNYVPSGLHSVLLSL